MDVLTCAAALAATILAAGPDLSVRTATTSSIAVTRDYVAGGRHVRFVDGAHGAVHVWRPRGFDRPTAGIVVYVHGYFTDVDHAFDEHHLAEQFRASRQNALFIVPEAPAGKQQEVFWRDLGELIASVERHANTARPDGPLVIIGHSGAYRTVAEWLRFRRVDEMILLDALYAREDDFWAWVESIAGHQANRLVIVSIETIKRSDDLTQKLPFAAKKDEIPDRPFQLTRGERNAQVLYLRSQYDHMALVTSGRVIPLLLRLTPLVALPK